MSKTDKHTSLSQCWNRLSSGRCCWWSRGVILQIAWKDHLVEHSLLVFISWPRIDGCGDVTWRRWSVDGGRSEFCRRGQKKINRIISCSLIFYTPSQTPSNDLYRSRGKSDEIRSVCFPQCRFSISGSRRTRCLGLFNESLFSALMPHFGKGFGGRSGRWDCNLKV